jgi:hypothetical protein
LEPCGYSIPPGRAWPAPRSESCVLVGKPTGRSVDSKCRSRAIEPRNYLSLGAFVVACTGAMSAHREGLMRRSCRGRRTGQRHIGFPRNLGDPERFHATISGGGDRMMHPWPAVWRLGPTGAKRQTQRMVSPREGNEAKRKRRRESHISIVPLKQGNLDRGDPGEGRGMSVKES